MPRGEAQFTYTTNNGAITITGYTGPGGVVSIPGMITGLQVTSVGNGAFWGATPGLTGVSLPDSITNIGVYAFNECRNVTNLTFGTGLISIQGGAFQNCWGLSTITLPSGTRFLGPWAFLYCRGLRKVVLPDTITNLGSSTFEYCSNLAAVFFTGNAPSVSPDAFAYDTNAIAYYLPGTVGWSNSLAGIPAVLWNPQPQTADPLFGVHSNQFGFDIAGTANIPIVVQAASGLPGPWTAVQTCTLTNGLIYFSDPYWLDYTQRFYRISPP